MSAASNYRQHSVIGKIYLLIGLTVMGMTAAYFAVPAELFERGRADRRFTERHEKFRETLDDLERLVLVNHLAVSRGPRAVRAAPSDIVGEMALGGGLRINAFRAEVTVLIQPDLSLGFAPLVERLHRRIEAFLAQTDSPAALEGVLLVTAQMGRLSVRAGELRAETAEQGRILDDRWRTGLLLVVIAGIAGAGVLIVSASRNTLRVLDSTIHQRNEQAALLQRERDFAARLVDTAPAIILVLDPKGVIQHVNPFFEQLTGWRLDEVRGRDWFATCLPERDRDRIRTLFQAATHDVPTRGNINAILTRSGEERAIEWNDHALHDPAGRLTGVLAVGIDVTERQRVSEALHESEVRTRQILDGLFGFVGVCTLDGTLIDANDAPLRAAGLRREDVLGRAFQDTYWWNYDAGVQAELQSALVRTALGEIVRYEPVMRIQGDALITIDVTFGPMRNAAGEITHILGFGVDITERKRASDALRSSERRNRLLVDSSPYCIHELDQEGRFLSMNRAGLRMLNCSDESCIVGGRYLDCVADSDRPRIAALLHAACGGLQSEFEFAAGNGQIFASNFIPLPGGRIMGLTADITARHRQSERLRRSEAGFRALFEQAAVGMFVGTPEGAITQVNQHMCDMLGYTADEIRQIGPAGISHPADLPQDLALFTKLVAGEIPFYRLEKRYLHKDGRIIWALLTLTGRAEDGRLVEIFGVLQDITVRKQQDEALRVSEERLRLSLQAAGQGLYDLDLTTGDAAVSPEYAEMIGHDPATFRETNAAWAERLHPDDRAKVLDSFEAYVRGEIPHYEVEFRQRTKSGTWLWTLSIGSIVARDPAGQPSRMLGTHTNIDAAKHTALALFEKEAQLRAIIEASPVPMALNEDAQRITLLNPAFTRSFGYAIEDIPTLADWWPKAYPDPAYRQWVGEAWQAELARSAETRTAFKPMEFTVCCKDGTARFVLASASQLAGGFSDTNVVVLFDITERKRTEAALTTSEAQLNEAQRLARVGSWELNLGTGYLHWSDEIFRLFEIDQTKFGATYEAFLHAIHPEDRDAVNAAYTGSLSDRRPYRITHRLLMADGRIKHVEEQCETDFAPDGKPLQSRGTVQDVTEQVLAQQKLRQSEEQLREAQALAHIGNWEWDVRTRAHYWSDEIYRIHGLPPQSEPVTDAFFIEHIHAGDRERILAAMLSVRDNPRPFNFDYRILRADGTVRHVHDEEVPVFDAAGQLTHYRGTTQDVTEQVLARDALRASLKEKETLLREIHHRVKNNLQIISSLLYFQTKKVSDVQALGVFGEVRDRLRSMMLVHEKLYNSNNLEVVDFADYVRSLVDQLAPASAGSDRKIHFKVETMPLALPIEQALPCGMILVELLTNVIKYAFPGQRGGEALVQLTLANGRVNLTVNDDGVGLPAEFDSETTNSFGWQLIRNLTAQLGGTTIIERTVGTQVTVSFPQGAAGTAGVKTTHVL